MLGIRSAGRQFGTALRALAVATVVLGIAYPLAITAGSQLALSGPANGSLVSAGGHSVGSVLIGQSFLDAAGNPLPQYFQGRPSAVDYDSSTSGGSNLGPENPQLAESIGERLSDVASRDGVSTELVPADAVTASASGLDPHISPEYARIQVERVAAARGLDASTVQELVDQNTEGRMLGFLGESTVNVLELNIALDALGG